MSHWPSETRLVHGEANAKKELAEMLKACYANKGPGVEIPS